MLWRKDLREGGGLLVSAGSHPGLQSRAIGQTPGPEMGVLRPQKPCPSYPTRTETLAFPNSSPDTCCCGEGEGCLERCFFCFVF